MVMCCSLPVPRSLADTFTIPFASISKVTSICGTPRHCRRDTIQTELSKGLVVLCKLSLTLQNVDINGCLVISCSREDLALLSRNSCISLNQSGCNATHGLNGQRQRSYIQQQGYHLRLHRLPAYRPGWKHPVQHTRPGLRTCWAHDRSAVLPSPVQPSIRVEPPTNSTLPSSDAVMPASFNAF